MSSSSVDAIAANRRSGVGDGATPVDGEPASTIVCAGRLVGMGIGGGLARAAVAVGLGGAVVGTTATGCDVGVTVEVRVGVRVGVRVAVAAAVGGGVGVAVDMGVSGAVGMAVGVAVAAGSGVRVAVGNASVRAWTVTSGTGAGPGRAQASVSRTEQIPTTSFHRMHGRLAASLPLRQRLWLGKAASGANQLGPTRIGRSDLRDCSTPLRASSRFDEASAREIRATDMTPRVSSRVFPILFPFAREESAV